MSDAPKNRISRRALLAGGAALGAGFFVSSLGLAAGSVRATRVRLGDHGTSTRFVLEISGPVTWRTFVLENPARLVLDIPGATFEAAGPLPRLGVISGIRAGRTEPNALRLVLDLARPALPDKDFLVEPGDGFGWRLVLDLVPVEKAAFSRNAGLVPEPVIPNTVTPEPSTRLGTASPGAGSDAPAAAQSAAGAGAAGAVSGGGSGAGAAGAGAASVRGTPGKPVFVRLANGRRVPVPIPKPTPGRDPLYRPMIVLDPGHGGRDPGALGISGTQEKTLTLSMARDLKAALEQTGRYRVTLTRGADTSIKLRDRIEVGRKAGGDLFISLHADALTDPSVRGFSVYTLSETASDAEAGALAERENKADILLGADLSGQSPDVASILIDLARRATMNHSALFASTLIRQLPSSVPLLNKPHRSAGFAVLKAPDMPSVLVEMGFLSNARDEALLQDKAHRARLASAIVSSIDTYSRLQERTPFQP
ncbi:N-acetylmuramoyl-L-alanine amidase [Phaeovibrio sulfidiphilus]|uniref:N-acetylmuramoyl-L-alanine amidase n=1 Tax=Phaeovibrio sulfidiphilus TaxID=1220600 RepID=A0A8J7CD55_9PROT|nr:N-acetylmuramoyl-L-alanine amidase [Phaeovibrio sulfidiphilus]MBE1236724.1 N-acetylmuramoyl-L-alanine amidase [Phaeovibrio sulfidiphilus]